MVAFRHTIADFPFHTVCHVSRGRQHGHHIVTTYYSDVTPPYIRNVFKYVRIDVVNENQLNRAIFRRQFPPADCLIILLRDNLTRRQLIWLMWSAARTSLQPSPYIFIHLGDRTKFICGYYRLSVEPVINQSRMRRAAFYSSYINQPATAAFGGSLISTVTKWSYRNCIVEKKKKHERETAGREWHENGN